MKQLFLLFLPFLLFAQNYTFSGGHENIAQAIAGKVLRKAYLRANIPIKTIFIAPEESLQRSNSGEIDGELARINTLPELYANLMIVPVPLVYVEAVAFSNNTKIKIQKWEDLKNYSFTIVKGTKFIEKNTKNLKKDFVLNFSEAFSKLRKKETEIIVIPKKAAIGLSLKMHECNIEAVSPVLKRLKLYHFVHKKNAHLIPIISPILKRMKDSGEIEYLGKAYLRSITNVY